MVIVQYPARRLSSPDVDNLHWNFPALLTSYVLVWGGAWGFAFGICSAKDVLVQYTVVWLNMYSTSFQFRPPLSAQHWA